MTVVRQFLAALTCLTRLPSPLPTEPGDIGRGTWAFPIMGAAVGAIAGAVYWGGVSVGFNGFLAAAGAVAAGILATGALHEDGLADVADGFGGGSDKKAKLRIMRDSRIGTYGVLALVVSLILRITAIGQIGDPVRVLSVLACTYAASRAAVAAVMAWAPRARSDGQAAGAGPAPAWAALAALVLATGAMLLIAGPRAGGAAVAGIALGTAAFSWYALRQIGGYTGDVLGATEQVAQVIGLLVLAAPWRP